MSAWRGAVADGVKDVAARVLTEMSDNYRSGHATLPTWHCQVHSLRQGMDGQGQPC